MFTKKGLDYGEELPMCSNDIFSRKTSFSVFGPILKDGLRQLSIPDMEDEQKVKVVGKVKYSLSQSVRSRVK